MSRVTIGGDGRLGWEMVLSRARLLSGRPASEIHVTTQSNVRAIVGKWVAEQKPSEVLFVKAGGLTCDALPLFQSSSSQHCCKEKQNLR